jgi:hypothetical protein
MSKLFETIKIKKLMGIISENEELDRILDKISNLGINSLTSDEQKYLQRINNPDEESETLSFDINDDLYIENHYNETVELMGKIGYDENGWYLKIDKDDRGRKVPVFNSLTEKIIIAPYWNNKKIILVSSMDKKYFFTEPLNVVLETIGDLKGWIQTEFFDSIVPELIDKFEERFYVRV